MILYQYLAIHASFVLFVVVKIGCKILEKYKLPMHEKNHRRITENDENGQEIVKWVPKKKHEVLKAKYKCLKKLFQIYDASVIGLLPDAAALDPQPEEPLRRHKRTYRTIVDASAGTTQNSSVNITQSDNGATIARALVQDLKVQVSSANLQDVRIDTKDYSTQDFRDNVSYINERNRQLTLPIQRVQKRKPTRFQSFIHRLLGINYESANCILPDGRVYAASDNNIFGMREKRRRRGLQVRRVRNVKKVHSEIVLGNDQSPLIFSHIQSIQRSCLLDTTQRQCPILGCHMIVYGIINYNDHLNLCHFPEKKFICHYCHEGFCTEREKNVHENEHIGITQLCSRTANPSDVRVEPTKVIHVNDTQTETDVPKVEVPEEKLQKIVSFFERIQDPDQLIAEIKRSKVSHVPEKAQVTEEPVKLESSKASRCSINVRRRSRDIISTPRSDTISRTYCETFRCRVCGETFNYRHQLALHTSLEHRMQQKFRKFHSCAGILSSSDKNPSPAPSSGSSKASSLSSDLSETSANIVYYTSTETVAKKPSVVNDFVHRVRTGFSYKWEPGTKIIRV
ncbi:uncharacterized protein LOC121740014 [Aricia agestis]|uniref:uncharacterized protein LOC121740014 n=1 Tax=Aricia agestis TaxID=91739 RepID=UPI001C204D5E|nr:uncharacterized protein LOC121740014 [Aricia agestis]